MKTPRPPTSKTSKTQNDGRRLFDDADKAQAKTLKKLNQPLTNRAFFLGIAVLADVLSEIAGKGELITEEHHFYKIHQVMKERFLDDKLNDEDLEFCYEFPGGTGQKVRCDDENRKDD